MELLWGGVDTGSDNTCELQENKIRVNRIVFLQDKIYTKILSIKVRNFILKQCTYLQRCTQPYFSKICNERKKR